ncbi:GTPase [Aggregatimonas sangjinii]|uniref:GTPase n=1 Tax=Aggregatimonas sangjinii TaxID=2583587 RepID=A0A5B7SPY4_9FLAO|nr:GTPase [Aggregatimonas sangjinii]QCW99040.1 GTPase [Aggregatimonas sangjinii]
MKNDPFKKLIFVYNADSGLRNLLVDGAHKILSPATYVCSLCDLTYGAFTENRAWKKFRKESDVAMVFLHKDEFAKQYKSKFGHKFTFPIVLNETEVGHEVLVTTEELNGLKDATELIDLLVKRTK